MNHCARSAGSLAGESTGRQTFMRNFQPPTCGLKKTQVIERDGRCDLAWCRKRTPRHTALALL